MNLGQFESSSEIQNYLEDKKKSFSKYESLHYESIVAVQEHRFIDAAKLNFQKFEMDPSDVGANFNAAGNYIAAGYAKKTLETLAAIDLRLLQNEERFESWRVTLEAFSNYRLKNYKAVHDLVNSSSFSRIPHALVDFHMLALINLDSIGRIPFYIEKYSTEGAYEFTGMKVTRDRLLINICSEMLCTGNDSQAQEYAGELQIWEAKNQVVDIPHDGPDVWNNKPFRQLETRGYAHFFLGEMEEAIKAWTDDDVPATNWPDRIERASRLGFLHASLGDPVNANLQIQQIDFIEQESLEAAAQKSYYKSRILSALGKTDEALTELDKAFQNGLSYFRIFLLERDPFLLPLHKHPSFIELSRPKE